MSAALARVQDFLLEPSPARDPAFLAGGGGRVDPAGSGTVLPAAVEVMVLGLRRGSGTSTLARGLATRLAAAHQCPSHLLAVSGSTAKAPSLAGGALGGGALWDVPGDLHDREEVADYGRMVARLAGAPAALVWDVPPGEVERVAAVAARAALVIAVASGSGEPALAELVTAMLADRFGRIALVANGAGDPAPWSGRAAVCVPSSRWGALLAVRGRRPAGAFGAALDQLAALVESASSSRGAFTGLR